MNKSRSIIILAAGKGSRMKSATAKVLHKVSGKEMLFHIIKASVAISDDVIVVIAHQKERVQEAMEKAFDNLTFVVQDAKNYPGTGGALMNVEPKHEDVLVLNGDMPLITTSAIEGFFDIKSDIVMSIFDLDNPDGYGRVKIEGGSVKYIVEQKDASSDELKISHVNAGVYLFKKSVLKTYLPKLSNDNAQNEYYLTDIIALANSDDLSIHPLLVDEVAFKGVNSKKDLADSEVLMQRNIKEAFMNAGVIMNLPETIYIEEGVSISGESIIENGVRITGDTLIESSHIKAHSVIEDSIIKTSDVGPLAHIRPNSFLKDTHIGNFVEVKKSSLTGVKAGHLSYIGDAQVDEGTNIGAGVITCNYDGLKKYKTVIGKNVFIGSDSQLVAPIIIEDDVMIAAGTTVTDSKVRSGVLAISRNKMRQVEGFFHKFFNK